MMADAFLEYSDVSMESMGHLNPGRIKLSDQNIVFKNTKTGKVETILSKQLSKCSWIRLANKPALKVVLKDDNAYRFGGFQEKEFEKVRNFAKLNWKIDVEQEEPCVKGWNYGRANFEGSLLEFEVDDKPCFDIPLQNVSNCVVNRNEAVLEFHMNDDCAVSLMEMRFHIPTDATQDDDDDPVEEFRKNVMRNAGVVQETDKPLAVLEQILCTTPRGRYDIKMFPSHLSLHGKTFDYKIPIKTIMRLFLLPHKDGRHMFFVVGLDPPIRHGQTRYHYLVLEFTKEEEIELELGLTEEQLQEKYPGKLEREMSGALYEVVSRIMRALVNQRITVPGSFIGHSGTPAIGCAYKSAAGSLYPLEKGFVCVHKPPMYIRFEEVSCVNFARSDVSTRSFDFEIELKSGAVHVFNSVEKEEYGRLYDFVNKKKLRIRNAKRLDKPTYKEGDAFDDSGDESEPDHYKAKLENEVRERQEAQDNEEDSEDEDSDYNPTQEKKRKKSSGSESEPDEEYDSDVKNSSDDSNASGAGSGSDKDKESKPKKKKEKPAKTVSEKKPRTRKEGKRAKKDPNAPKKAQSSYMIWFLATRESLKEPGMSITDVAKKGGKAWKELKDRSEWDEKAKQDKERYIEQMKEWNQRDKSQSSPAKLSQSKSAASSSKNVKSPSKASIKSKEYVSSDDDSSDESDDEPLSAAASKKKTKDKHSEKKSKSASDQEEEASTPVSGGGSDSD